MKKLLFCCFAICFFATAAEAQLRQDVERMTLHGLMGERFDANHKQWMLTAPYANPGMLEMYARRNDKHQIIVKW